MLMNSVCAFHCQCLCTVQLKGVDTRTCAAGCILLGEDYIMCSIFELTPVTFVPASSKLSGR